MPNAALIDCFPVLQARHAPMASDAASGVRPFHGERPAITLTISSRRFSNKILGDGKRRVAVTACGFV
jgi:hypothetical protein